MLDGAASNTTSIGDGVAVPKSYFEASILWRYLAAIRKMSFAEIMSQWSVKELTKTCAPGLRRRGCKV